ncbi:hypothetical protein PCK1_003006 [Pneumocystis canis]|nr:hypothetical protein PCK1_003006 [Pneumocystis canis]
MDVDSEFAFIQKNFTVNFIICYTALFIISCLYGLKTVKIKTFSINLNKLKRQFIYYLVRGHVIKVFSAIDTTFCLQSFLRY